MDRTPNMSQKKQIMFEILGRRWSAPASDLLLVGVVVVDADDENGVDSTTSIPMVPGDKALNGPSQY
jgi:hypothetical protein